MAKLLIVNYEKCHGCRMCELVCSLKHTGTSNPSRAHVHVIKWEDAFLFLPMFCQHCVNAPCMSVCPTNAIYRDEELNRVMVDYDFCIGCRYCVAACPFGSMGFDVIEKKVSICDLCDGDPMCIKFCDVRAIDYVEATTVNFAKMREASRNFANLIAKALGEKEDKEKI